jgi:hypothetical protein
MADEPEAERLESQEEEEEGGPVKSFLEYLEDLRWVLIKSLAAGGVAMVGCFFAGNYVFQVLEWPLKRAPMAMGRNAQVVRVTLGTNQLWVFHVGTNEALSSLAGTNRYVRLDITPVTNGTNILFGVTVQPESEAPNSRESPIDIVSLGPAAAFIVATDRLYEA